MEKEQEVSTEEIQVEETEVQETVNEEVNQETVFESEGDDSILKVDLSKPPPSREEKTEDANTEQEATNVVTEEQPEAVSEVVEEVPQGEETVQDDVQPEESVIEEITEEEVEEVEEVEEQIEEAIAEAKETGKPLPENIEKLIKFMEETGGDLNDYVSLNRNIDDLDNAEALAEYYKKTKPHLTGEEINFMLEDRFSYDEDVDEERDIKRKKLALKEQVADAKAYLDGQKSKYYEDIKAGSKLTSEQQEAIDFFNRYDKESKETQKIAETQKLNFQKKTNSVFNDKFKGFEYSVGEKKFRFNVKDANKVKETQSDINNFVKKFLNKENSMEDAKGYHKSLFTAMNADAIANHFYEQGRADAVKDSVKKGKNINVKPRGTHGVVEAGGIKVKVLGDDSSDFKFKIKNRK